MKTAFITAAFSALLLAGTAQAQKLNPAQVPSVIVNSFQKAFPKAADVEWKQKGELYKVEFETGTLKQDHDAWYNTTGKLVKHKEEITTSALPAAITAKIKNEYSDFRVHDVEKITEGTKETYQLELKKSSEKWQLVLDVQGNVLTKKAD